ncbi:hypothetical protein M5X04_26790 [Paenibacillus alvei]|uniref:Bro-N domain-containing protein n=1 Tax=Paenibacillus alvei TaxID=44250 RepID=A0ABT4EGQ1_PAEAL|nr:BRO family protein [Paenibacillus alvei]MCY9532920.1 hypothetical protein [Paenibacillus alvei]
METCDVTLCSNSAFGEIEVVLIDDSPWFGATKAATLLGYSNPQKAIRDHCTDKGCTIRSVLTGGGKQQVKFITEGNLYRLISRSKLPNAEQFESWVFDEVLPTIRKTGGYVANDELFIKTYLPHADEQTVLIFRATLETVRGLNDKIQTQQAEIEHKEAVIVGLVDEIDLATKRQILNRVVRKGGMKKVGSRWNELYKQFEMKYHINLGTRLSNYNTMNTPKLGGKLDYIDKVMGMIPELYEIACKIYERDIKELTEELYSISS